MEYCGVRIIGTGSYLPEKILTNADLEKMVDTSDEWIRTRTGISERHIASDDEPASSMGAAAARLAMENAGIKPEDIDLLVVATITPDEPFPNTGCFVQARLGLRPIPCFSVEAACTGFLYALEVGSSMIRTNSRLKRALIIGTEKMSTIINWKDRTTCVLFGDGAGAVVIERCSWEENELVYSLLASDGRYTDLLHIPAGGSRQPLTHALLDEGAHYLQMRGQEVFKHAVTNMTQSAREVLEKTGKKIDDIAWMVPHQANTRIIYTVADLLGLKREKCYLNIERIGNCSAATIPIALDEMRKRGLLKQKDYLLLVAFGGGLTWGASLLQWNLST